MKANLIDLLNGKGFTEKVVEDERIKSCNGLVLHREWSKEIDVVWYGKRTGTFSVQVFINQKSGICHVAFSKGGRENKEGSEMYGSTRVTLSLDELTTLKAAMAFEVQRIGELVECIGDPNGIWAKNRAEAESLYEKLGRALERVWKGI